MSIVSVELYSEIAQTSFRGICLPDSTRRTVCSIRRTSHEGRRFLFIRRSVVGPAEQVIDRNAEIFG